MATSIFFSIRFSISGAASFAAGPEKVVAIMPAPTRATTTITRPASVCSRPRLAPITVKPTKISTTTASIITGTVKNAYLLSCKRFVNLTAKSW